MAMLDQLLRVKVDPTLSLMLCGYVVACYGYMMPVCDLDSVDDNSTTDSFVLLKDPCYICLGRVESDHWLNEWLIHQGQCDVCQRYVCENCIEVCHSCANAGRYGSETPSIYCLHCRPTHLKRVSCPQKCDWNSCQNDDDDERVCGECYANRNYSGKMQ